MTTTLSINDLRVCLDWDTAEALLALTCHPRYTEGLLALTAHADSRDATLMRSLSLTPRAYSGRMESQAFLGMSATEVYEASGRAQRDRRRDAIWFHCHLQSIAQQGDTRDYERMRRLTLEDSRTWMQPHDKQCGYYTPIAMRYVGR